MSTLRLSLLATSLLVVSAAACAPSDVPPAQQGNNALSKSGSDDSKSSSSGSTAKPAGSAGGTDTGSSGDVPKVTDKDKGSPCADVIGKWTATFDDGAEATGDMIPIGSVGFSGKLDFTMTHDEADINNVVDFVGTATIEAMGQTNTYQMQPSEKASGDVKDTTCTGGLHVKGISTVDPIGDVIFTMDGDFDDKASPPNTGHATFTMKTADDDGKNLTGKGTAHITRQK